jgi:hypothetical protein
MLVREKNHCMQERDAREAAFGVHAALPSTIGFVERGGMNGRRKSIDLTVPLP